MHVAFDVTELIRLNPKTKKLPWTESAKTSFENVKQALVDAPILNFPSTLTNPYLLVTDSSGHTLGAALYHIIDYIPHPIG